MKEKPPKPYRDFPLYSHRNGQWAKKIRGKTRFFGTWNSWRDALKEYELSKGVEPTADAFDLQDLVNLFLHAKQKAADSGEILQDTHKEYARVCARMLAILGPTTPIDTLRSAHFQLLREKLVEAVTNPTTLKNTIVKLRVLFAWAYDADHVEQPLRYRDALKRPPVRLIRGARNQAAKKLFSRDEINLMLKTGGTWMKAAVYMGINCGVGNRDLCELPRTAITGEWMDFPRPKNEVSRKCWLWPETRQALEALLDESPESGWVFCGESGQQLGQGLTNNTPISHLFRDMLDLCKIESNRRGFYTLRHTYRTVADAAKDQVAVRHTMGHADHSIDGIYRETIDDSRLRDVAALVRSWLLTRTEESPLA